MYIFLTILLILAGLIALILIIALFSKREYFVDRSVIINKPKAEVFNFMKHLKNQVHYFKFVMMDPNMNNIYKGNDGTVGFVYGWNSKNNKVGEGEQEIKNIKEGEQLEMEVRFVRPFAGIAYTNMYTETVNGNQTKVRWTTQSKMPYPMNAMLLFVSMDNLLGKDFQESLDNMKKHLEDK